MTPAFRAIVVNCNPERAGHIAALIQEIENALVVAQAYDGRDGLRIVQALHPDLVVTCIALSGKSGLELTSEVKSLLPLTRVLVVSSQAHRMQEAIIAGADIFIPLPAKAPDIQRAIRALVTPAGPYAASHPSEDNARPSPSSAHSPLLRKILDPLANGTLPIAAYLVIAIAIYALGLDRSPSAPLLFGGSAGILGLLWFAASLARRPLMTKEEKAAEDAYQDWLSRQRGP